MKRIGIVGYFAKGKSKIGGQEVKTCVITEKLKERFGENEIFEVDTTNWKRNPIVLFFKLLKFKNCKNIIMLPAQNSLKIITPILAFIKVFSKCKLHYCVIGGWLSDMLKTKKSLAKRLKRFDGIYVETSTMKTALEEQGFTNVFVLPNCKNLHILDESELVYNTAEPFKLCTFSRVMKEKGIEDAVEAVKRVNESNGRIVYTLDIYGQVDSNQIQWFDDLQKSFPEYVKYGGCVAYDKSVEVLKAYFALLFPTRFYTEGIPGTVIDAYAAGVPVISAKWESFSDVIDDKITGIGYAFDDVESLIDLLKNIAVAPRMIKDMKQACIFKAKDFTSEKVIKLLFERLDSSW